MQNLTRVDRQFSPIRNANGSPASFGKIWFCDRNTTRKVVTSSDLAGTAPNNKVVSAKGDGQLPPIFIPEGTYTVHITVDDGTSLAGYPAEGMTFGSGAAMAQKLLELEAEIDELRNLGA